MSAVIDLRDGASGSPPVPSHAEQRVSVPYGMEVVQVGPSTLTMEFEMSGVRIVPVEPDVDGRPAPGTK